MPSTDKIRVVAKHTLWLVSSKKFLNTKSECSQWPGIWDGGCCCGWGPGQATWGGHPFGWTRRFRKHQSGDNSYASRDHSWCSNSPSSAWRSSSASWGRRPASWSSSRRSWVGPCWRPPSCSSSWNVDNVMLGFSGFRSKGCCSHCTIVSTEQITVCRCNQHSLGAIVWRGLTNYAVAVPVVS